MKLGKSFSAKMYAHACLPFLGAGPLHGGPFAETLDRMGCVAISSAEKAHPYQKWKLQDFYQYAECPKTSNLVDDGLSIVVGDLHGAWDIAQFLGEKLGLFHAGPTAETTVKLSFEGTEEKIKIPNLEPIQNTKLKMIFVGDYIGKSSVQNGKKTLAVIKDWMEKSEQSRLPTDSLVFILGNHDFEAVNGVYHEDYAEEKSFGPAVQELLEKNYLRASHYSNGIWYSHSYLTRDDFEEARLADILPRNQGRVIGLDSYMQQFSARLNSYLNNQILSHTVAQNDWLISTSERYPVMGKAWVNFMYAMDVPAGGLRLANGLEYRPPMVTGHLSDLSRRTIRVLTEGYRGRRDPKYANRSHVLNVDTSIYYARMNDEPIEFLAVKYLSASKTNSFYRCRLKPK